MKRDSGGRKRRPEKKASADEESGRKCALRLLLHCGHRRRMRNKARENGLDGFKSHEAAELLLFEAIPRHDTNETAHRLMETETETETDGGEKPLMTLLTEDPGALAKTEGVGEVTAGLISSVLPRTAALLTEGLRAKALSGRWALLPAADLRLNRMGEAGAVLLFGADGRLTDWLPARDTEELLRLAQNQQQDAPDQNTPAPASWIVLIRQDAAEMLVGQADPTATQALSAHFPGAEQIGVLTPERKMVGI